MSDQQYTGPVLPVRSLHLRENTSQAIDWRRKNPTIKSIPRYIKGLSGEIERNNMAIAQNCEEANRVREDMRNAGNAQWKSYAQSRLADICIHNRKLERDNKNLKQQMEDLLSKSSAPQSGLRASVNGMSTPQASAAAVFKSKR